MDRITRICRLIARWLIDYRVDWDRREVAYDQRLAGPRNTARINRLIVSAGYTPADMTE